MLLDEPPNTDGLIPKVMEVLLIDMGACIEVNGDVIYATRPWTVFD